MTVVFAFLIVFGLIGCTSQSKRANFQETSFGARTEASKGVYYCIFVRSFADSDGDGIGDFNGLTQKLDYLNDGNPKSNKSLGVTGIWLMPIFPSPSYHGYDVTDYYSINPEYGTMADFENFLEEAKKRDISVIIDMTFNHSSSQNPWFFASKNPESPYRSWYRWLTDETAQDTYNLNQMYWGHRLWNKLGNQYYSGIFDSAMPDFNQAHIEVQEEFKKISKFWLDKGVDGFRFDAASHVFNKAKLPYGEEGIEQALAFWKDQVDYILSINPEAFTVGEVWEPAPTRASYIASINSVFHFDLDTVIINSIKNGNGGKNNYAEILSANYEKYEKQNPQYVDAPFLTNHDQNRFSGLLKGDPELIKLAASMYMFTEGTPFMYYGEEIGMMGAKPDEQIRTPLMWNDPSKDSLQTCWIESKYNKNTVPISKQQKDSNSILNYYKKIIRLKTTVPALVDGRLRPLWLENSAIVSWYMESEEQDIFVLFNVSSESQEINLPKTLYDKTERILFSSNKKSSYKDGVLVAPERSTIILELKKIGL